MISGEANTLISFSISLHGLTLMFTSRVLWFFLYCLFTMLSIHATYYINICWKYTMKLWTSVKQLLCIPPVSLLNSDPNCLILLSPQTHKLNIFKTHWASSLNLIFLCFLLWLIQINIHSTYNSRPWSHVWRPQKESNSKRLGATFEDFLLHHLPPYPAQHPIGCQVM